LRGVANITVLPRDEVGRTLAGGLHIIMTTSTTAEHLAVVKFHCRLERLRRMAALATVGTENVGTVPLMLEEAAQCTERWAGGGNWKCIASNAKRHNVRNRRRRTAQRKSDWRERSEGQCGNATGAIA
jgi:hypothetical protein